MTERGAPPEDLEFAVALAARAGEILMDRYERLERIDYKSARDVVTEADHLSEELIIESIRAYHPADAILAEESGEHHAVAGEAPTSGRGRVWVIDPLDGTVNYANGIPFFCVSIGLVVDGRPTVGVVHDPTRAETFAATERTGRPCSCRHWGRRATRCRRRTRRSCPTSSSRWRSMRPLGRDAEPERAQGDPYLALDGLGGAGVGVRRQRPVRRVHPAGWPVGVGHRRGGADRGAGRRHG